LNKRLAFYADLADVTVTFGDKGQPQSWVHALPGGTYQHPIYGELDFNDTKIRNFAESVTKRYRGIDPDIDYDHKQDPAKGNKAAGWVKAAESRPSDSSGLQDLWVLVEWTPEGYKALKEREFRYFSSEVADEWEDAKGNKYKDVFFGGGITNRPYMKNLVPVNLSELRFDSPTKEPENKGDQVDPKELRRKLNLPESATDAEVDAKLSALAKLGEPKPNTDPDMAALAKLAESNPVVKAVLGQMEETNRLLKEAQERAKLAEATSKLSEFTKPGVKVQLSAAVLNDTTQLLIGAPQQFSDKMFAILKAIVDGSGVVALGEKGDTGAEGRDDKAGDKNAIDKFNDEVAKLQKEDKLSFGDAVDRVARTKPNLYDDYRRASYIPAEA
jgi:phage I-like protein